MVIGVILGALSVIFVLQNVAIITVTFFSWQITGSLALILFSTLVSGIVITLLILLPGLIQDEIYLSVIKKQKKEVEEEFARYKTAQKVVHASSTQTVV